MVDWRTDDRELLARILTAEAGNQGPMGMTAAGNVIMNRANTTGYGNGVRGVIMKPGQFSPMNSVTGYAKGEQGQNIDAIRPNETAYTIADNLLSGTAKDITGGATHFYNPDISNPSWAKGKEFKRIGDHVFGSADAGRQIAAETMQVLGKKPQGILAPTQTSETESKPMMQEDKPRGLLGSLGIQKMQEGAAGETGQRFYERDTFKDTAATLAQGFAAMGSLPGLQKMAANIAAERSESKAKNKTVEFLRKSGREDLAAAVESGSLGARDAAGILFSKPKAQAGIALGDRVINPVTGEVIYEDTSAPKFEAKDVAEARKEFSGLAPVKDFQKQSSAYGRILSSLERDEGQLSPAGDLALIFNYMKVLDPGSTVREGEFATAAKAGSFGTQIASLVSQIETGELLTESQRADFADRATRLYQGAEDQFRSLADQYGSYATARGLPVERVIPDFSYSGSKYERPLKFSRPPAPAGVSPEQWAAAWNNMTDQERREFLGNK